jgi:clan AA aspartic protease (TIGR02281 family)
MEWNLSHRSSARIINLIIVLFITASVPQALADSAAQLTQLGEQRLSRGEYDKAVKTFEQVIRLAPDNAEGYAGLGLGYLKLGSNEVMTNPMLLEKGVEALTTALRINPALTEARRNLGLTWLALGSREKSLPELKILEKADPRLAAELASAIAAFQPHLTYRAIGTEGKSGTSSTKVFIERNAVLVPVTLSLGENSAQAVLLLDTGAAMTVISPEIASLLGVRLDQAPEGTFQVVGGGTVVARAVRIDNLTVGPHSKTGVNVAVIEQKGHSVKFNGLLGMDILRNLSYQVDFKNKVINWIQR